MRFKIIGIVILLSIIGFVYNYLILKKLNIRLEKTINYRTRFVELINHLNETKELKKDLYIELVEECNEMQYELGNDGIAAVFIDPIRGLQYNNYQLLINFYSELRTGIQMIGLMGENINILAGFCDEAMIRHRGTLKELINMQISHLKNPILCFSQGIRFLIKLPIDMLFWSGIISEPIRYKIHNSIISIIIQKIIVSIGLISSLISIIIGLDEFKEIIRSVL